MEVAIYHRVTRTTTLKYTNVPTIYYLMYLYKRLLSIKVTYSYQYYVRTYVNIFI